MSYFSTDVGSQIHDIHNSDDYFLCDDQSQQSILIIEKREELSTMQETETLEREWERNFHTTLYVMKLRERAVGGTMPSFSFRSVAWQVFLEVLPGDLRQWGVVLRENRARYSALKTHYVVDPHETEDMSLTVNNPLSQEEQSPWAQYFLDTELRATIMQDLKRTYPGELMFEQEDIRAIMLNILFIYAREQPHINYKQGMHELLAPLMYVFHNEFTLANDVALPTSQIIRNVLNLDYIEHDLYWCYVALMKHTTPYYATDKVNKPEQESGSDVQLFRTTPAEASTYIVQSLEELQNSTLRRFDPELTQHLQKLAIQPQLYGLRWMRLLFGREFQLREMLTLWDALFAAPEFSGMVEFISVAMLLYIRDALLCTDYTGCLTLLMRYPETPNVRFFVQRALYLRNPSHYECPPNLQYRPGNSRTRLADGQGRPAKPGVSGTGGRGRQTNGRPGNGAGRSEGKAGTRAGVAPRDASLVYHAIMPSVPRSPVASISQTVGTIKRKMSAGKISLPQPPDRAREELSEQRRVASYCSDRLDSLLDQLQTSICEICDETKEHEDKLMLSLAGLKQVRDILKGNVSLGCILSTPASQAASVASSDNGDNHSIEGLLQTPDQCEDVSDSTSCSSLQPSLPPADLETLNLFTDFSLSSNRRATQSRKIEVDQTTKSKDFFDPLTLALDEEDNLSDFLGNR